MNMTTTNPLTKSSHPMSRPKIALPKNLLKAALGAPGSQIQSTLVNLQQAMSDWDQIPEGEDSEIEQLKKKTRELIQKLNEQIKSFDF